MPPEALFARSLARSTVTGAAYVGADRSTRANRVELCGCISKGVHLSIRGIKGVQHHDRDGCSGNLHHSPGGGFDLGGQGGYWHRGGRWNGSAFGFISPVAGPLLQEVIDVAVILNALRALRA